MGHDRGVYNPQRLDSMHTCSFVDHRADRRVRTHTARPNRVMIGADLRPEHLPENRPIVVVAQLARRQLSTGNQRAYWGLAPEAPCQSDGFDHARHVIRVLQQAQMDAWRRCWIRRAKAHPTGGSRVDDR